MELFQLEEAARQADPSQNQDALQNALQMTVKHRAELVKMLERMQSPQEVPKCKYWHSIMCQLRAGLYRVQRSAQCPPSAVCKRVQLAWQSFDCAQFVRCSQWQRRRPVEAHSVASAVEAQPGQYSFPVLGARPSLAKSGRK